MVLIFIVLALYLLIYLGFIAFIAFQIEPMESSKLVNLPSFSVVIPFRNEVNHLEVLLNCIDSQMIENVDFEVVLVDDHSTDNSVSIIQKYLGSKSIQLILNDGSGKKSALHTGIKASSHEIIMTIDADVSFSSNTFKTSISEFISRDLNMLCGLIAIKSNGSVFQDMQRSESSAIVSISSVMLNHKMPTSCNGAHLVFKKSVFNEIGAYKKHESISSGDDDLLMHEFAKYNIDKVKYSNNFSNIIECHSNSKIMDFVNQRGRWASKMGYYQYFYNQLIYVIVILNLIGFYVAIYMLISKMFYWAIAYLIIRYIIDFILFRKVKKYFKLKTYTIFLMPFYLAYIFPLFFYTKFAKQKWKGRPIN